MKSKRLNFIQLTETNCQSQILLYCRSLVVEKLYEYFFHFIIISYNLKSSETMYCLGIEKDDCYKKNKTKNYSKSTSSNEYLKKK